MNDKRDAIMREEYKNIREALTRMYRAAKLALKYDKAFEPYESPFTEMYGEAADAIYWLIGEDRDFKNSVTYSVLHSEGIDERYAVGILFRTYVDNVSPAIKPEQPKPTFVTKQEMMDRYMRNGGYMYETPEGEWP